MTFFLFFFKVSYFFYLFVCFFWFHAVARWPLPAFGRVKLACRYTVTPDSITRNPNQGGAQMSAAVVFGRGRWCPGWKGQMSGQMGAVAGGKVPRGHVVSTTRPERGRYGTDRSPCACIKYTATPARACLLRSCQLSYLPLPPDSRP